MTSVTQLLPNFIQGINDQPDELKKPGQVRNAVNVYPDVVNGLERRKGYDYIADIDPSDQYFSMIRQEDGQNRRYVFSIDDEGNLKGYDADTGEVQTIKHSTIPIDLSKDSEDENLEDLAPIEYLKNGDHRFEVQNDSAFICNKLINTSMSSTDEQERPYEAFVEITTFDQTRAYVLNVDAVGNENESTYIATKIEMYDYTNFGTAGETPDCNAVGSYTISQDTDLSGDSKDQPIVARVTLQATPRLSDGDETRCNYFVQETRLLSGGSGWKTGDEFRLTIPGEFNGVKMSMKYRVTENIKQAGPVDFPNISATVDGDDGTIQSLLVALREALISIDFFAPRNIQIVGNGLYIKADLKPFKIDTSEPDLINVINNQALFDKDWEEKKALFPDPEKSDFNYQYPNPVAIVNNASDLPLKCKNGFLAKVENTFNDDDDYYVRFVTDYGDFEKGSAGGDAVYVETSLGYWKEVAKPGEPVIFDPASMPMVLRHRSNNEWVLGQVQWAERTVGTAIDYNPSFLGSPINNMVFYRNRLVFMSGQNVITSSAGDYTNFFPSTALAVAPSDPVDLETNTNYSSTLHAGIEINNALVVFGQYQQFLLTTDSDVFDSRTAKLSQLANYEFDIESEPFIIGTNVGFMGPDKMYEMTNIFREGQVDVQDKSKLVFKSFGEGYSITNSAKDDGLIVMANENSNTMWLYKYFKENSQQDIQSAWFKWEVSGSVKHQFISNHYHYIVMDDSIRRMDMNGDAYMDSTERYETRVELPTFFVKKAEQQAFRSDTTSSLTIHRMHLNTGDSNYYTTTINRYGKDDYVVIYEQSIQDNYDANSQPITYDREQTIPIYERNINVNVTITADYDGPFTLFSLRWEGDYNDRFYKRI